MPNGQILVVDDEPDILELCERILSTAGYQVYSAANGAQAIAIARETPFDLLLIDIRTPDRDGISTYEVIKSYQPDIICVVTTTGYPSMEAVLEALRKGIAGFVPKPFTADELRESVGDALERWRLQRDNARLQALIPLYEITRSLMTTTDLNTLLNQVVEIAIEETGADRASLMLEENNELVLVAARGLPEGIMHEAHSPVGEGIAGWVAEHGKPLLLDGRTPTPSELADALTREEIASAVCTPLALKDRVIGVLNLSKLKATETPFTASDRDLITVLAGQAATAIENARLFRQQRRLTEQLARVNANLQALQQAATAMTSRLSPQRVLQTILDGCTSVMEDATIALGLLDADELAIEVHLHHGETRMRERTTLALSPSEARLIETQTGAKAILTDRLGTLLRKKTSPASIGVIPLSVRDQLLGAMAVGSVQELTEADIAALTPFADQAAVAFANARLFTRLQQAYEDLQEVDRLKSEFIHIAAHELRAPLSVIKVYTGLLSDMVNEAGNVPLDKLREAADRLESSINDLIELRNLEIGAPELRLESVRIDEVINTLLGRHLPLAEAKQQELSVEVAPDLPPIQADRAKLEVILGNLMSNAIKFTPAGGALGIRADTIANEMHITVWDTGLGIPPEQQAHIFDRFHQATDSLTQQQDRAGLGLSIVRRLVELHHGHVKVESEVDQGSAFTVILPLNNPTTR